MVIYVFYGDHKDIKDELLLRAAEAYSGRDMSGAVVIRPEEGKPFFRDMPLYFSVSHTDGTWGCLMSDEEVGFDLQMRRPVNHEKIAERFFSAQEAGYIDRHGADGFFDIWTRKEACVKYHGAGIIKNAKAFSTVCDGKLTGIIDFKGSLCRVDSFDLTDRVKCAYCRGTEDDQLWVREL